MEDGVPDSGAARRALEESRSLCGHDARMEQLTITSAAEPCATGAQLRIPSRFLAEIRPSDGADRRPPIARPRARTRAPRAAIRLSYTQIEPGEAVVLARACACAIRTSGPAW